MASAEPTDAIPMKAIPQPSTSAADKAATDEPSSQAKHRPPPIDISEAQKLSNNGPKTPTTGGPQTPGPSSDRKRDKERKIGHRRVDEEGQITYKKIYTSQIMGSIQLGIGYAVGSLASKPERDLLMQDFAMVETTYFPGDGSNITPAHHYSDFRFKTYAPVAFRYFRDLFGIQPDDFLLSLCNEPMRELANPGASGSIFYLTLDDEFIIKTVQHKEAEFLQKLLPGYYMNLNQNPRTLLPKFFGLYCYQCGGKNVRVVVMNNLLPSSIKIHQKYDLKGSTYKRKANKHERTKESPTYKDLDFMEHHPDGLLLEAETYNALVKTIHRDCRVLESFKIMDYSLLVGIHNLDQAAREKAEHRQQVKKEVEQKWVADGEGVKAGTGPSSQNSEAKVASSSSGANLTRSKSINRQRLAAYSTAMESIQAEVEPIDQDEDVPPGGIPARNGKGERLLLFLGIIDILQSYRLKKKLEHTWKSMLHDGDTVSVHRPSFYAQRFQDFMAKTVFRKIPSLDLPEIKGPHRKFRTLVSSVIALKHSPSKRKGASVRQRPPSSSEADGAKTTDTTSAAAMTSKGQEAKDSAKDTSGTDVVPSTIPDASTAADTMTADTLTTSSAAPVTPQKPRSTTDSATSIRTGIRTSPTVIRATSGFLDQSDAISISQITLQTESLGSVVSESSSSTSGIGSTIRTVTWTPPHSTEGSTPTHTEGTPSFTESSSSGDVACPTTPIRGVLQQSRESLQPLGVTQVFHETEITRL